VSIRWSYYDLSFRGSEFNIS